MWKTVSKYQDIYPSEPLIDSNAIAKLSAADLLTFEYFEAEPSSMPEQVFDQHHILINLNDKSHRVENWRDGEHRDFTYNQFEIVVTPAGVKSGWKWHEKSKVIVITLEPAKLEKFALQEVGVVLTSMQLNNVPQFKDEELTNAARYVLEALENKDLGFDVMFESLSRVFLVKLIKKYGELEQNNRNYKRGFTSQQYKKVLDYVKVNFGASISLDDLSRVAGISRYHFSRLFKEVIGKSPMQYVQEFRLEQAKKLLQDPQLTMSQIADQCGFTDQAHFSRLFKQIYGKTPKSFR